MYFLQVEKLKAYAKNFQKVRFWGEKIRISYDFVVYSKLLKFLKMWSKKLADLFAIKWEFDKMGYFAHFRYKKLKWDPILSRGHCTSKAREKELENAQL